MDRKYYLVDAQGKILGRMATQVANLLSGRKKVSFTPHIDDGDFVVIVNSDGIKVSGGKETKKIYHRFSGYPGGITSIALGDQMKKDSRKVIEQAIYGMLPKNKLRASMLKRLKVYAGAEHPHKFDFAKQL